MATGKEIASKVPPPSKLVKSTGGAGEPVEGDDDMKANDDAAALGLMETFQDAVKNGTAEEALQAYRDLKDGC